MIYRPEWRCPHVSTALPVSTAPSFSTNTRPFQACWVAVYRSRILRCRGDDDGSDDVPLRAYDVAAASTAREVTIWEVACKPARSAAVGVDSRRTIRSSIAACEYS